MNLPGSLQALEKPLGLPRGIKSHADEIKQQDGVNQVIRTIDDVANLRKNNKAMFEEAKNMLQMEAAEDEAARRRYGTERWGRPDSAAAGANLIKQLEQYTGHFKAAKATDDMVKGKFNDNERILRLLSGPDHALSEFVPNSHQKKMMPGVEKEVANLRSCLNEVNRLEDRRWKRVGALRDKASSDDISKN